MSRIFLSALAVAVAAAAGVAQTPPPPAPGPGPAPAPVPTALPIPNQNPALPPVPIPNPAPLPNPSPPPVTNFAPPPPATLDGTPVVVQEVVSPVETLVAPRVVFSGDIGTAWAWRGGRLAPAEAFAARPLNFPIPSADFDDVLSRKDDSTNLAARLAASYTFERLPLTVTGAWETIHAEGNAHLLGYNPDTRRLLGALNEYNEDRRDGGDDGWWPMLRMRPVAGDAHDLRTRLTANVATATAAWKLWTPREEGGIEYRVLAGGRYGGFYTDDRAIGDRYEQSASNWYSGFGPEAGARIDYVSRRGDPGGKSGARLWGDVRGGALFGESVQRFRELDLIWGGDTPYRELVQRGNRTVPFLAAELGIGFGGPRMQLGFGVRYNQYWGVGDVGPSRLDIGTVAGFLRLDVGF